MRRVHRLTLSALILSAGLLSANGRMPAPSRTGRLRGLPAAVLFALALLDARPGARLHDCFHGPSLPLDATNLHPEIAPGSYILKYPCPPADPASTLIPTPTPPATSRFRY